MNAVDRGGIPLNPAKVNAIARSLGLEPLMHSFSLFVALLLLASTHTVYSQVFDVGLNDESPTRTLFIPADSAKAVVLLFPGGGGVLRLDDEGSTKSQHTFVRSSNLWKQYGIDAVLVDSPYDLGNERLDRRPLNNHLERIRSVVNFYKQKTGLAVWIFGHSRGTVSATRYANQGKDRPNNIAGLIVAGTLHSAVLDSDVVLPALAIHHKDDKCRVTPPSASESLIAGRAKNSAKSKLVLIDGGNDTGDPCQSFAHHGFNEREPELINAASGFILGN